MSVVTDTTNHENGGMGDSRIAPTGDWTGAVFRGKMDSRLRGNDGLGLALRAIRESPLREVGPRFITENTESTEERKG